MAESCDEEKTGILQVWKTERNSGQTENERKSQCKNEPPGIDTIGTLVLADLMPSDGRDMLKLDEKEQQNRGEQLYTDNSVFAMFFEKLFK